jgi:mono/diheme cytochrome c family protein
VEHCYGDGVGSTFFVGRFANRGYGDGVGSTFFVGRFTKRGYGDGVGSMVFVGRHCDSQCMCHQLHQQQSIHTVLRIVFCIFFPELYAQMAISSSIGDLFHIMPKKGGRIVKLNPSRWQLLATVGTLFVAVGGLIQFVPYGRDHINPPVLAEPRWDSEATRAVFFQGCADCHSNQTAWPWYSHVAPVSWFVSRDVQEGRMVFNVSEWGRPDNEGDDAAEAVQDGSMPLWFYLPLHPEANLTPSEKQAFIQGLNATFGEEGESGEGGNTNEDQENEESETENDKDD